MRSETITRELRVAFSRQAQPLWFRVVKWGVFVSVTRRLYGTPWVWVWLGGLVVASVTVHVTYRWKTRAWTQPWGGWHDTAAVQGPG